MSYNNDIFGGGLGGSSSAVDLTRENDALSQKLRAAQHKVDELAATVERMITFIKLSAKKWEGVPEVEPTFWNLLRVANETPQQHLRDVQAEAGRAGVMHMHNILAMCYAGYGSENDSVEAMIIADQYAERVKAGVE